MRLPGAPALAPRQLALDERVVAEDAAEIRSDTGELHRNLAHRYATIDTPRTKAVYGFLGALGWIELRGLRLRCKTDFAVIALSSLSDAPLDRSDNILLTAVGRADNTDATYNDARSRQYSKGRGPILAEVVEVDIALDTAVAGLKISAISTAGMICGPVQETLANGTLSFTLGGDFPSIYYLIQKI